MNKKLENRIVTLENSLEELKTKFKQHVCPHLNPKLNITEEVVRLKSDFWGSEKRYSIICPDCGLILRRSWDITLEEGIQLEIEEKQKELKELKGNLKKS